VARRFAGDIGILGDWILGITEVSMTRRGVYTLGLLLTIACTVMSLQSIILPRWVSYSPDGKRGYTVGLHQRCSTATGICHSFPRPSDCTGDKQNFCNLWRTVGFLISFTVVVELATLVSFAVIVAGGVQRRSTGWKIISSLLVFSAVVECAGMGIVAHLYNSDDRFRRGWSLDSSWKLSTASWMMLLFTAGIMGISALCMPPEGDYEAIPDYLQMEVEQDEQLVSRISIWNDGFRAGGYEQNDRDRDSTYSYQ